MTPDEKTDKEKKEQKIYDDLFNDNDPKLRADVITALNRRGIGTIDPFHLELALKYHWTPGDYTHEDKNKKSLSRRLTEHIIRTVRDMQTEPENARWAVTYNLVNGIVPKWGWYDRYDTYGITQSTWETENQTDPAQYLDMLRKKEDPRFVALLMVNVWASRYQFMDCAQEIGADILSWDDARAMKDKERRAHPPENLHLCEEMYVNPAGIVAVEPFNEYKDFDYDLYGATIGEVTAYTITFVPKAGTDPRLLQKHVEDAIKNFIEDGEITFTAPNASYNNPENAYDRPQKIDDRYWERSFGANNPNKRLTDVYAEWYSKSGSKVKECKSFFDTIENNTGLSDEMLEEWVSDPKLCPAGIPPELYLALSDQYEYRQTMDEILSLSRHTIVNDDGHVVLNKTLILDDVLELYKFCGTFLTPCEQIATALNAARYAEECGPLKTTGELGRNDFHSYTSDHTNFHDRLGNMAGISPEDMVDRALHDMMVLAGNGQKPEVSFMQAAILAHQTAMGSLPDGTGRYPTLRQITDQTKTGENLPALAEKIITERTRDILDHAAANWGFSDPDLPLKERFERAAAFAKQVSDYQEKINAVCKHYERNMRERDYRSHKPWQDLFESERENPGSVLSEGERKNALDCLQNKKPYTPLDYARYVFDRLEGRTYTDKETKKPYIREITPKSEPPAGLDALDQFIWRHCRDLIIAGKGMDDQTAERKTKNAATIRGNIALWGGEVPPQLPRGFDGTSYTTRDKRLPFARAGTDLPPDLAKFIERPSRGKAAPLSLPDPNVVWGKSSPKPE